jgi:hypothetical protein
MFDFLVTRVNESMGAPKGGYEGLTYIGCLDIFGFEIFQHNSFEQLCINFTNEMLQQHFNKETFKKEQLLYEEEGINVPKIEYVDNQPIIDMISKTTKKVSSLLTILHDELAVPGGSDEGFFDKIKKNFAGKKGIPFGTPKDRPECFRISHYAGNVRCGETQQIDTHAHDYDTPTTLTTTTATLWHCRGCSCCFANDGSTSPLACPPRIRADSRTRSSRPRLPRLPSVLCT